MAFVYNISCADGEALAVSSSDDTETVSEEGKKSYIKYIDFNVTEKALSDALKLDIQTYDTDAHLGWVETLSYLAVQNGGDFKGYKSAKLEELTQKLDGGADILSLVKNTKLYNYYLSAYGAVLGGMVGSYIDSGGDVCYGLRAFSPIAAGYYYNHYDDFGVSRSYGYKREHLGHDLMGSVGTPVIACESGYVEACGWNQYGGWRIGIRSFDGLRYYYYAHLRKNHPYNDIYEGKIVNAGEVIGYLGMTGYSAKENVNNIDTPHLHWGLEIIFDPSQKDGYNQIWVDMYALTSFLYKNRAEVNKNEADGEYYSNNYFVYTDIPD